MSDATVHVGKVVRSKSAPIPNADAFAALKEIVAAAREYGRIRQEEQTKRAAIAAAEHVQVDRIHSAEKILSLYFERVFAERAQTSGEMFVRLDQAMVQGTRRWFTLLSGASSISPSHRRSPALTTSASSGRNSVPTTTRSNSDLVGYCGGPLIQALIMHCLKSAMALVDITLSWPTSMSGRLLTQCHLELADY